MAGNESFGMNPEDMDRFMRGASEQLRGVLGKLFEQSGGGAGFSMPFDTGAPGRRPAREPETAGEAGDGAWAIYTVDDDGSARVEQIYASELDALRANKHNTDSSRRVRFLPYGIAVSVLDTLDDSPEGETP